MISTRPPPLKPYEVLAVMAAYTFVFLLFLMIVNSL